MAAQTLFAYVLGTDLDAVAADLEKRFDALLAERTWALKDVWVVQQRVPEASSGEPAVEWDLGFNLTLPAKPPAAWADDIVAIANAFAALQKETKRSFVIGIADKSGDAKDLFDIDGPTLDEAKLRDALEAATAKSKR